MTVDEALDRLERYEQLGLGSDVIALKTLRRYVERVREVGRSLAAGIHIECYEDEITCDLMAKYGARLEAAREGRDDV